MLWQVVPERQPERHSFWAGSEKVPGAGGAELGFPLKDDADPCDLCVRRQHDALFGCFLVNNQLHRRREKGLRRKKAKEKGTGRNAHEESQTQRHLSRRNVPGLPNSPPFTHDSIEWQKSSALLSSDAWAEPDRMAGDPEAPRGRTCKGRRNPWVSFLEGLVGPSITQLLVSCR